MGIEVGVYARSRRYRDLEGTIPGAPRRQAISADRPGKKTLPWPVRLFLASLVVPWVGTIGSVSLYTSRVILLAMVLPCLAKWMRGASGRIRTSDIALLLFCLWSVVSLVVVHGPEFAVKPAGILFVETMGAYLVARCYIRDADDFFNMARMLFRVVAFLFPFALLEALTGRNVLLELFAAILPSFPNAGNDMRAGLWRAQVVFEHSILFGICAASALAVTHLVLGHRIPLFQRWLKTGLVGGTALLSLSSAPIAAIAVQAALMMWSALFRKNRYCWKILWCVALAAYLAVLFGSNQSPIQFYISKFTFEPATGWHRLLIWEYGSASVLNQPLFGIGFEDWARSSWMPPSVDMFWLLTTMRFGIPGGLLMVLSFFAVFLGVSFRKGLDERLVAYRTAYLIMMIAFFLVGWTVHYYGTAYLWFIFLLGSGVWLLDVGIDDGGKRQGNHGAVD
ncbi:O-antigen ligase family protein [Bradyrhizobium sp. C-145]|uniref:O-antigen ligase family protein n=1 Tax=Bradyrhizobium sp. C-145 TaxID=574727 RepID=UPI00201B696B|nr:O-antigen ligase family protein [Bradyrhizobium sp. C-145]UQR61041.1 O-antigen ligase family protein [Bradyrhizobium sp. C-145]